MTEHPDHDLMRDLFDQALDTGPAHAALDRLTYCWCVGRLTDGDTHLAQTVFSDDGTADAANQELDDLDDQGREELAEAVIPMWNTALSLAVNHLFRTCRRLGYDPEGLDPKHTALVASVFLGPEFTHLAKQLAPDSE
jgi:hypothetical protein